MITNPYVRPFDTITAADISLVGGKGANLGQMTQAGFPVPPGFCVTTTAFQQFIATCPDANDLYDILDNIPADDIETARHAGQQVRERLGQLAVPPDVAEAIVPAWHNQGEQYAYAVRSSATAEDLPAASFAGQQDTFLNIRGEANLLQAVRDCWVSLFTDRAILYRQQNGFSHRDVFLSVVVQRMVMPEVSGILFTADPVSNHRHIASIDASYGLGEALVAGLVSADLYKVDKRSWQVIEAQIADKGLAIRPLPEGGTVQEALTGDQRTGRVLSDVQAVQLAEIGYRIEQHYGRPQDIEWALEDGQIFIVQSRPITSLFPLPKPRDEDGNLHVYISFNHAQVMTDPMPPMSHAVWRLLLPFGKPGPPTSDNPYFKSAGGRLYLDVSPLLHIRPFRHRLPTILTAADPLIAQAVQQIANRNDFNRHHRTKNLVRLRHVMRWLLPLLAQSQPLLWWRKPEGTTDFLTAQTNQYIAQIKERLSSTQPGLERLQVARDILGRVFVEGAMWMPPYLMAGMMAKIAILDRIANRYGQKADVDALMRGLEGNVTTEMDLQVGDLADVARQSPALAAHLQTWDARSALETAASIEGGSDFLAAWAQFMEQYGMRGPSEIDITRPRWYDDPTPLMQVILGNLGHQEAGVHRQHHRHLATEGERAGERLAQAARQGLLGPLRARLVRRMVRVLRHYMAMREHPKFLLIQAMELAKQVMVETAVSLKDQDRIDQIDDIWYLYLTELIAAVESPAEDLRPRIRQRRANMARYQNMRPPRVMTSDGEIPVARHSHENLPEGAIPGNPVSAGVIEGIARVVLDPTKEILQKGEILIAPFTDPGWTPLFINAAGLVMEVGGLMTHGSVVAREYGIPAVVGVLNATEIIQTGQRIRVQGDQGYVEILDGENG